MTMLSTFRKIRKNLVLNNKTSKYLQYAIGEILLVVIGILIALQINNWNEQRKEQNLERKALHSLKQNIVKDSLQASEKLLELAGLNTSLDSLKRFVINDSEKLPVDLNFTDAFLSTISFISEKSTFDELKSSGRLQLIRNKSLSDSLMGYYNFLDDRVKTFSASLATYARDNFAPYLMSRYKLQYDYPGDLFANYIPTTEDLNMLKNDRFFSNAINYRSYMLTNLKLIFEDMLDRIDNLLQLINKELNEN